MFYYPKVAIVDDSTYEIERLIHTVRVVIGGFYSRSGMVVLPELRNDCPEAQVVLPQLEYEKIPFLWKRIEELIPQFPMIIPKTLVSDFEKIVTKRQERIVSSKVEFLRHRWRAVEEEFWLEIKKYFTKEYSLIDNVEVRMTKIGSISSYSYLIGKQSQKMIIYLREDGDVSEIAESVIASVLCPGRNYQGFHWEQRETIVDFVMGRDEIKKLFPEYRPTLVGVMQIDGSLRKISYEYLCSLGLCVEAIDLEVCDELLYLHKVCVESNFGDHEKQIIKLLLDKRKKIVSVDELADTIWGVGEFKSVWAINKMMQRLRNKLIKLGLRDDCIETIKGRGYILR